MTKKKITPEQRLQRIIQIAVDNYTEETGFAPQSIDLVGYFKEVDKDG